MQAYLQTDPKYAYRFKYVWLWNEFPGRKDFGGQDTGIDLVALTHEGDYWVRAPSNGSWSVTKSPPTRKAASAVTPTTGSEVGNPSYILDLLLSVISVSIKTMKIVKGLPEGKFE